VSPVKLVTRDDLRLTVGRIINAAATGIDAQPTEHSLVRAVNVVMDGVDLYVDGLLLDAITQRAEEKL
jgi:hypothetical protein